MQDLAPYKVINRLLMNSGAIARTIVYDEMVSDSISCNDCGLVLMMTAWFYRDGDIVVGINKLVPDHFLADGYKTYAKADYCVTKTTAACLICMSLSLFLEGRG